MYYINPENNPKPEKGKVLLAEPFLEDPFFKRTVILLCEHNEEGSFGFVLNHYIKVDLNEVLNEIPDYNGKVSLGGPVKKTNLYYLHTMGRAINNSIEVTDGIFLGGDFEELKKQVNEGAVEEKDLRFFVGYSGWSPQQLEEELEQNSWYVADVKPEVLMNTNIDDLWKTIIGSMGKKGEIISKLPEDPNMN